MHKNRHANQINCASCFVRQLCMGRNIELQALKEINSIIINVRQVKKGEHIHFVNDAMENLLSVYRGSCKSYIVNKAGEERIDNFFFPGDIIGIEGIPNRKYFFSIQALEDSLLCEIPLNGLFDLMQKHPALLKRMINIASYKIQNDKHIAITTNANQRVADFILNIYYRIDERQQSTEQIILPMSQKDISNYLGLSHETVNRILQKIQKDKIIELYNKQIHICDIEGLKALGSEYKFSGQIT